MNNTSNVSITIASDKDPKLVFETLKAVGLTEAILNGTNVRGVAVNNLVEPLRTVDGVADITVVKDEPKQPTPTAPPLIPPRNF